MQSGEPELLEFLREILVGDVVQAVLCERLLLGHLHKSSFDMRECNYSILFGC